MIFKISYDSIFTPSDPERWSVSVAGLIAIGCTSGATFLFNLKQMNHKVLQSPDKKGDVMDIQWDRLSTSYLLIAYTNSLALWDR